MDDNEKIQSFGDLVDANEKLTKPWRILAGLLLLALVVTNLIWGYVHYKQIEFAYMTPVEFGQEQLFDEHAQSQNFSSGGATDGK